MAKSATSHEKLALLCLGNKNIHSLGFACPEPNELLYTRRCKRYEEPCCSELLSPKRGGWTLKQHFPFRKKYFFFLHKNSEAGTKLSFGLGKKFYQLENSEAGTKLSFNTCKNFTNSKNFEAGTNMSLQLRGKILQPQKFWRRDKHVKLTLGQNCNEKFPKPGQTCQIWGRDKVVNLEAGTNMSNLRPGQSCKSWGRDKHVKFEAGTKL